MKKSKDKSIYRQYATDTKGMKKLLGIRCIECEKYLRSEWGCYQPKNVPVVENK
jgi:hypothetical protein